MQATLEFLATFCCAIFAGAAIYINAVEHPARLSCGTSAALAEWAPSYTRATIMQASLAVSGFGFSIAAWLAGAASRYLVAGVILGLVVPFTLIIIRPTNTRLLALDPKRDLALAATLLARWNRLHLVRSVPERAGPRSAALAALIVAYVPRFPTTISRVDARFWGIGVVTRARGSTGNRGRITPQLERSPMPRPRSRAVRRDGPRVPARGPRAPR